MSWTVLIPIFAYLALSIVRMQVVRGGVWPAVALWGALFAAAAVTLRCFPALLFYPDNDALQRTASEAERLKAAHVSKSDVIILIEGSSVVTCDVRGEDLERELRKRGLPARVIQISAGGSNHFERIEMLREWLRRFDAKETKNLRKARVFLLAEVLYVYDHAPLQGFAENAFSTRSVAYATPENLGPMLDAVWMKSRAEDSPSIAPFSLILEHVFFNVFKVGTFQCVKPPTGDYSAKGDGRSPVLAAVPKHRTKLSDLKNASLPYSWWHAGDDALRSAVSGWVDEVGYLALPTRDNLESAYQRQFIQAQQGVFWIDGTVALPRFDTKDWSDKVHLNSSGAHIFTDWLAGRIAADWPRISGASK